MMYPSGFFLVVLLSPDSTDLIEKIFLVSLYPIVVFKLCIACRQNYLIRASLPRSKRLIFSTSATHISPCVASLMVV